MSAHVTEHGAALQADASVGLPERATRVSISRPFLIFLSPGPVWDINARYGEPLTHLSTDFRGLVLTTSGRDEVVTIGEFQVRPVRFQGAGLNRAIRLLVHIARQLVALRRQGQPVDAVVCYDPLLTGALGWLVRLATGAALVVEVNGDYRSWDNHLDDRGHRRPLRRALLLLLEGFVLRRATAIKLLYASQVEAFRGVAAKFRLCHVNYVKLDSFLAVQRYSTEKVVLFVGFPFHVKGVDVLIAAFKRVHARHPNWRLRIIGHFPEPSPIEQHVDRHEAIDVCKPVKHDQVAAAMAAAEIFVLPSRTEAMGRVLLEAAAVGVARIASRVGGTETVIEDGEDGLLVPPEDVGALAGALDRLMTDDALRARLAAAGAARARREFTVQGYVDAMARLYRQAIRMRR